jgi:hypothetical protein
MPRTQIPSTKRTGCPLRNEGFTVEIAHSSSALAVYGGNPSKLMKSVIAKRGEEVRAGGYRRWDLSWGTPNLKYPQWRRVLKGTERSSGHTQSIIGGKSYCASTITSLGYGASKARDEERPRAVVLKLMTFFSVSLASIVHERGSSYPNVDSRWHENATRFWGKFKSCSRAGRTAKRILVGVGYPRLECTSRTS